MRAIRANGFVKGLENGAKGGVEKFQESWSFWPWLPEEEEHGEQEGSRGR
jgi:hypothetical protein